jgi:subtilisin family serine protease
MLAPTSGTGGYRTKEEFMTPKKPLLLLYLSVFLAIFTLFSSPHPVLGASAITVEPELEAQLAQNGTTGYIIHFRNRPDLSSAISMEWKKRGEFVVNTLKKAALTSQAKVRQHLDLHSAQYKSFWIGNLIVVEQSDLTTFKGLLSFTEIERIGARPEIKLHEPVTRGGSGSGIQTVGPNISHVKADQVWALGYTGSGIVVANIDTGVRYTHQALVGKYRGNSSGVFDHNYNWWDPYGTYTLPTDNNGHGTHTMGTMVGDDGGTNQIGMAPGAKWIACRGCNTSSCTDAALLECAQFIAAPWNLSKANADPAKRPHVVNNSWGGSGGDNWFQTVVNNWVAAGIYPVFSNGNSGPGCGTVGSPGDYPNVTGVGAIDHTTDLPASFSSRGPTTFPDVTNPSGFPYLKPQVSAPGVNIRSSVNTGDSDYQEGWSGTSMAAPHVAGLVALMYSAAPSLLRQYGSVESVIQNTATGIAYNSGCSGGDTDYIPNPATGWGVIDALKAVQAVAGKNKPGWLKGTVLNAATNAAIPNADILVEYFNAATDSSGKFSLYIPAGAYSVYVSANGYKPQTVSATVVKDATTNITVKLNPNQKITVTGTVKDGSVAGWPLYATVKIANTGFTSASTPAGDTDESGIDAFSATVKTDPVTGKYSVGLYANTIYSFTVSSSGYNTITRNVTPSTTANVQNFTMTVAGACDASGYTDTVFTETFDKVTPPAIPGGWAIKDITGTTGSWVTKAGTRYPSGIAAHSTPNLVYFNSYSATSGSTTRLYRTTGVNLSTVSTAALTFWMYHDTGYETSADSLQSQVSTDSGATWKNVGSVIYRYDRSTGWKKHTISLNSYTGTGKTNVRIAFLGKSRFGNDVHIDDIEVTVPCRKMTGGLIVGYTRDQNTLNPLSGIAVTSNLAGAVGDTSDGNGYYTVFSPAGASTLTAKPPQGSPYGSGTTTATVTAGTVLKKDIPLPAGKLSVTPTSLSAVVISGTELSKTLTIKNTGGKAATFEINIVSSISAAKGPFEKPAFLVKKELQEMTNAKNTGGPDVPEAPLFAGSGINAAGDVIQSWASGLTLPWGIGYDIKDNTIWADNPTYDTLNHEYTASGTATGRTVSNSYGGSWSGDMAYDPKTKKFWQVNVGGDNCVYQFDPATGPTGSKICPSFTTSMRGLAYNPKDDTFFAGSWMDSMIHHFNSAGTMLDEKNVGLYISGLAYNPDTKHLFVMINASSNNVYVLDASTSDYTSLGNFPITGFASYAGAGLEMDCDGKLWAPNQGDKKIYQVESGETTKYCSYTGWLTTNPVTGAIAAGGNKVVTVTLNGKDRDLGVYKAGLVIKNNTPYPSLTVPVTMDLRTYLMINGGAACTTSGNVTLTITRPSTTYTQMCILNGTTSCSPTGTAGWEAYAPTKAWTLDGVAGTEKYVTLLLRIDGSGGATSGPHQDSILWATSCTAGGKVDAP